MCKFPVHANIVVGKPMVLNYTREVKCIVHRPHINGPATSPYIWGANTWYVLRADRSAGTFHPYWVVPCNGIAGTLKDLT